MFLTEVLYIIVKIIPASRSLAPSDAPLEANAFELADLNVCQVALVSIFFLPVLIPHFCDPYEDEKKTYLIEARAGTH